MKASQMIPSKYLKKEDIERDTLVTVAKLGQADVSMEDQDADLKWTVKFKELEKPMVLNVTNINAMTEATGTDETDEWIGKKVVVYVDPNVMFAGKRVGGLRIRKAKNQAPAAAKPVTSEDQFADAEADRQHHKAAAKEEFEDEIPF